jgi:hypothetical protein
MSHTPGILFHFAAPQMDLRPYDAGDEAGHGFSDGCLGCAWCQMAHDPLRGDLEESYQKLHAILRGADVPMYSLVLSDMSEGVHFPAFRKRAIAGGAWGSSRSNLGSSSALKSEHGLKLELDPSVGWLDMCCPKFWTRPLSKSVMCDVLTLAQTLKAEIGKANFRAENLKAGDDQSVAFCQPYHNAPHNPRLQDLHPQ